ncbi:MAG: hypothetical protein M1820_003767 [Bogoriella megaspora]|nr:MAG: hypothetical protein M1820_003767 [Bogoriella megaspora]
MVEKRKATSRAKGEGPAKRRVSSQAHDKDPKETPVVDLVDSESAETTLPSKLGEGAPLPTLKGRQPMDLRDEEYQSVARSGVLAEALKRSREKWKNGGVLERYWKKPSKSKNGPGVPDNNPDLKSMRSLGYCNLIIEPHVFSVELFTVDANTGAGNGQASRGTLPSYRPTMQYGPPNGAVVTPPAFSYNQQPPTSLKAQTLPNAQQPTPLLANGQSRPFWPQPPNSQPSSSPQPIQTGPPAHQAEAKPQVQGDSTQASNGTIVPPSATSPAQANGASRQPHPPPQGSGPPSSTAPDAVIHMLAKKASSDPELTTLMKLVAAGQASEEQLKTFQQHIDSLTAQATAERKAAEEAAEEAKKRPQGALGYPHPHSQPNGTLNNTNPPPFPPSNTVTPQPQQATPQKAYYQSAPLANPPTIAAPRVPTSRELVIEFDKGGDRFLFPYHSILEFLPEGDIVIASFIIVRRGSDIVKEAKPRDSEASKKFPVYDPALDYWEGVTVRFSSGGDRRMLEVLKSCVAPLEESQKYMEDVMDKTTRAQYVHLAMRLPVGDEGNDQTGVEEDVRELSVVDDPAAKGKKKLV